MHISMTNSCIILGSKQHSFPSKTAHITLYNCKTDMTPTARFLCRNPGLNQDPLDLQSNTLSTEQYRLVDDTERQSILVLRHSIKRNYSHKMKSRSHIVLKICTNMLRICLLTLVTINRMILVQHVFKELIKNISFCLFIQ